jgi:hypothetical protein
MPKYFFRDTGFEAEALSANGKNIYLLGVSCTANSTFKIKDASGAVVLYVGAGNYNLPATVNCGGDDLYVETTGLVSIIYHTN